AHGGGDAALAGGTEQLRVRGRTERAARGSGAGERRDGDVARGAARFGNGPELVQQEAAAPGVVETGPSVARRQRSRPPAERVLLQPRVVGQRREAGERGIVDRLLPRVLLVVRAGLLVRLAYAEIAGRDERHAGRGEQTGQLARLAGVEGRDQDAGDDRRHGRGRSAGRMSRSVFLCCSNSRLVPWAASSSITFISSGEKGVFSPVPWTST